MQPRKPGKTLVEFHTDETFGTLNDMSPHTYHIKYICDVEGFAFKRYVPEDNHPTRWECIRGPRRADTPADWLAWIDTFISKTKIRADKHKFDLWVDNRTSYRLNNGWKEE